MYKTKKNMGYFIAILTEMLNIFEHYIVLKTISICKQQYNMLDISKDQKK